MDHANLAVSIFRAAGMPAKYYYKSAYFNIPIKKKTTVQIWGHAQAMVYFNKKCHHSDTVRKEKISMGAQKDWLKAKVVYNDNWSNEGSI